jgi:DNA-binding MarR family transcriptional regulator
VKLSPTQHRALLSLSFGASLNLRLSYTKATVEGLKRRGFVSESNELYPRRCYYLTDVGRQALAVPEGRR